MAAAQTREVFWQFPPWAEVLWYCLAVGSVFVFAYGVARPIAKYRRGNPASLPPLGELRSRIGVANRTVFSQASVSFRDPYVGWAHRGIFYGFLVLFIGTVILAINTDLTEPLFGWRFFEGDFYLVYSLILDTLGVALLVGLLMIMFRRAVLKPKKLDYTRPDRTADDPDQAARRGYRIGDWIFVGTLFYLVVTGYMLEGVRIAMDSPANADYSPFGWLTAQAIDTLGMSEGALEVLRHVGWWSHGLVALAFVSSIPYTKAIHMLTSYASLVLKDDQAGKRLRAAPTDETGEPTGYGILSDFLTEHLVQLDACTKCGKCHEACPANATGMPLSPRDVVLQLREDANDAMRGVGIGGVLGSLMKGDRDDRLKVDVIGGDDVREETVWSCMQCNACVEACPVGIEQAPMINQLRRRLVEEGRMEAGLTKTLQLVHRSGNSFGENRRKRGRWVRELDFEVKDAREEPVDVLWFVGDYASFDPRSQEVTRSIARLLREAGVDFGILYDGEQNSGNDVRRVGEEGLFELLAETNIATLAECSFNRIVTSDPHSLNTLSNEYSELGGSWEVLHHTSLLADLLEGGQLKPKEQLGSRVTYHDPCYLGRHNGGYDDPRRILEAIGCELIEMPRNRDNSFCCGAGGGRIWMTEPEGHERPSENRIREALGLGELDYFVVACPKDVTMYEDAVKTTGNSTEIAVRELAQLVEEAVGTRSEPTALAGV
ncbi:MAG: (Fe-S)-binding protein [Solirubrobacterales bacterium]|nr:(Fe-S)-binding protein [Solirubrobacterales bacterium]